MDPQPQTDREPHKTYQASHRMPRVLIVATPKEGSANPRVISPFTELFVREMDCSCLKFVTKGADNIHLLAPSRHEGGILANVRDVVDQAVRSGKPYDVVIVDSEAVGKEIMRLAETLDPKPAAAIMIPARDPAQAQALRGKGIPAFVPLESLVDRTTRLSVYDGEIEKALGEDGLKKLALKPGEASAYEQWLSLERGYKEVKPAGAIRSPLQLPPGTSPD